MTVTGRYSHQPRLAAAVLTIASLSLTACGLGVPTSSGANSAQADVTVGQGGSVSLGNATLVVPPKAVTTDGRLIARTTGAPPHVSKVDANAPAPAVALAATPVSFQMVGTQVVRALTLRFLVPGAEAQKIPGGRTNAVWLSSFDPQTSEWLPVSSRYDSASRTVTALVPHLSWWAVWTWDWQWPFLSQCYSG